MLQLGDPVVHGDGGVYQLARFESGEVDLSIPEWDRPPAEVWMVVRQPPNVYMDRSVFREAIPRLHPGAAAMSIRGIHRKWWQHLPWRVWRSLGFENPVSILFNGESLKEHATFPRPTIGMNRTFVGNPNWHGPSPDYLCIADNRRLDNPHVASHPGLINGTSHEKPLGVRISKSFRMKPFSFDLDRDGYVCPTAGYMSLQVAVYMGFTDLHCYGLDLVGGHFDGTDGPPNGGNMTTQDKFMKESLPLLHARGIKLHFHGRWNGEGNG